MDELNRKNKTPVTGPNPSAFLTHALTTELLLPPTGGSTVADGKIKNKTPQSFQKQLFPIDWKLKTNHFAYDRPLLRTTGITTWNLPYLIAVVITLLYLLWLAIHRRSLCRPFLPTGPASPSWCAFWCTRFWPWNRPAFAALRPAVSCRASVRCSTAGSCSPRLVSPSVQCLAASRATRSAVPTASLRPAVGRPHHPATLASL